MLSIFICEDIEAHKNEIKRIIENYILFENYEMKVVLETDNPNAVIDYLEKNECAGLYFLDVDLKTDMTGIVLAERIRKYDPRGFIVFISAYPETLQLTFEHKVEAMDFIVKQPFVNIEKRIQDCIENAHQKYTSKATELQKVYTFKQNNQIISVDYESILFFESSKLSTRKIIMQSSSGRYEYNGYLKDLQFKLDNNFYRCHKSFIVNIKQIRSLDIKNRLLLMNYDVTCPVSSKNLQEVKKMLL